MNVSGNSQFEFEKNIIYINNNTNNNFEFIQVNIQLLFGIRPTGYLAKE